MRDAAIMRAFAPRAATVRVTFHADGYAPSVAYPLVITMPNGTSRRFTIAGPTRVQFTTPLPSGLSSFRLRVPTRPAEDPVGVGHPSIQTSPWSVRGGAARPAG